MTKTCVLLIAVKRSDVRPTLRDVMTMYSQDRYMKNLPKSVRRSRDKTKWWFTVMVPEETLDALENLWSVMGSNSTWKLQKSLRHPEIPRESGDVTQASTSGEAESTSPTEGMVVAPQIVTCM